MILKTQTKDRSAYGKVAARTETKSCSSTERHKVYCLQHWRDFHPPAHLVEEHLHLAGDQYQYPPGGDGMISGTLRIMFTEKVGLLV